MITKRILNIVILGAGNVGSHLALNFHGKGHRIVQVFSRTYAHAEALAQKVGAQAVNTYAGVVHEVDVVVLALSDDAIPEAASHLASHKALVVHTSGTTPMAALHNSRKGVFYPLQTFSKHKLVDFSNIPILIEAANTNDIGLLEELGASLSGCVQQVASDKRAVVHLAAVFACNFTNYMYHIAGEVLATNALKFDLLRPLITETASKVMTDMPCKVQTGPAVRNDSAVIKKHLHLLEGQPELHAIYDTLSKQILNNILTDNERD